MNDPRQNIGPRPSPDTHENGLPPVVARPAPRPVTPPARPPRGTRGPAPGSEGSAWSRHAPALADWVLARLKVRADAHGAYRRRGGRADAYVEHADLSRDRLIAHFRAEAAEALVGVHVGSPRDTARFTLLDIDAHGPDIDKDRNLRFALHALGKARSAGLDCRLLESNGAGGYHLLVVYPQEVPLRDAWRLGMWLKVDAPRFGLAAVESFPKSPSILHSARKLGCFVRLPGLHHTRPHRTRVWDPSVNGWLAGEPAIRSLLRLHGTPAMPGVIPPPDFLQEARREPARTAPDRSPLAHARDVALARSALNAIGEDHLEPYDEWVRIGMSLRGLGEDGLALWHEWSERSDKYEAYALDSRWDGFAPASDPGHAGLGTLFYIAEGEGWERPDELEFDGGEARVSLSRSRITVRIPLGRRGEGGTGR